MNINLFVNHYQCGDEERQAELDFCVKHNTESNLFANIILFGGRVTYNDFFKETANYPNDINILSNVDIYFNETILKVLEMGDNDCYCITRWEEVDGEIRRFSEMHDYNNGAQEAWSQDTWVIKGKARRVNGQFHLGIPGCDNRIAYEFHIAGYNVSNPCPDIQCIHKHKSPTRNYQVPKGMGGKIQRPYKFIAPRDENPKIARRRKI